MARIVIWLPGFPHDELVSWKDEDVFIIGSLFFSDSGGRRCWVIAFEVFAVFSLVLQYLNVL